MRDGTRSAFRSSWKTIFASSAVRFAPCALLSLHVFAAEPVMASASSPEIRVRLESIRPNITLSGIGLRFPGLPQKRNNVYQALRVKWSPAKDGFHEWTLEDRDTGELVSRVRARALDVSGSSLRLNLKPIPGRLTLRPTKRGELADVITALDLETYVLGVLPSEMPRHWPLEALKAQAVAARTFALFRKQTREKMKAPYDVETSVMDQVYLVPVVEEGGDESRARVEQAVRETTGVVMMTPGEQLRPVPAHFHADCGGRTEDARLVWGYSQSVGTAVDGACPLNPAAKWRAVFKSEDLEKKLKALMGRGRLAQLSSVVPFSYTDSGRIHQLKANWSDGQWNLVSAHDFRMIVGHDKVKSTNFKVERVQSDDGANGFAISGQGFGHGVGLCQWGARHLAQNGKGFREILGHYYPKALLTNLHVPGTRAVSLESGIKPPRGL